MDALLARSEAGVFRAFESSIARAAEVDDSLVTIINMTEAGVPLRFSGRRLSTLKQIEVEAMVETRNEEAVAAWNSTAGTTVFFEKVFNTF